LSNARRCTGQRRINGYVVAVERHPIPN
jgi:hypothetical protein